MVTIGRLGWQEFFFLWQINSKSCFLVWDCFFLELSFASWFLPVRWAAGKPSWQKSTVKAKFQNVTVQHWKTRSGIDLSHQNMSVYLRALYEAFLVNREIQRSTWKFPFSQTMSGIVCENFFTCTTSPFQLKITRYTSGVISLLY